jgi:hypothetical protein
VELFVLAKESVYRYNQSDCCNEKYINTELAHYNMLVRLSLAIDLTTQARGQAVLTIASFSRDRKAGDQRDKVFALQSLVPDQERHLIAPDYAADLKYVYLEFAASHIRYFSSFQVLSYVVDNQAGLDLPS